MYRNAKLLVVRWFIMFFYSFIVGVYRMLLFLLIISERQSVTCQIIKE